jgi:DNA ligase-1
MRTVLPALAQAVFINSSPNFYHEGRVENLKEKLQVIISASCNGLLTFFHPFII